MAFGLKRAGDPGNLWINPRPAPSAVVERAPAGRLGRGGGTADQREPRTSAGQAHCGGGSVRKAGEARVPPGIASRGGWLDPTSGSLWRHPVVVWDRQTGVYIDNTDLAVRFTRDRRGRTRGTRYMFFRG